MKEGWKIVKLGEVCEIFGRIGFRGYTTKDLVESPHEGAISLSPSNIVDGRMDYSKCTYISWYKYNESPEIMIFNGDILLVKTGSSYGKSALVEGLPHKATINPQSVVLKNFKINNKFLAYQIRTKRIKDEFDKFVSGTAIPTFSQAKLSEVQIFCPPLEEQHRIVSILDASFEKIDALKKNAEENLANAKALFLQVLAQELKPKEGWKMVKLGEVCEVIAGQSPDSKYYNKTGAGIPFYQEKKEFTDKYIGAPTTWTTMETKIAEENDILMSVRAPVGDVNFAIERICIGRGLAAIRPSKMLNKDYLYYYLVCEKVNIKGKEGAVFPSINRNEIRAIEIPLPPLEEQHRIVSTLDTLSEKCRRLEQVAQQTICECDALKQSILRRAFSGEL